MQPGAIKRFTEVGTLQLQIGIMRIECILQTTVKLMYAIDDRTKRPESVVFVTLPSRSTGIQKNARTRSYEKLCNLAAHIAQISVGTKRVAHVNAAFAPKIDMHMTEILILPERPIL